MNEPITQESIAAMIDVSAVQTQSTWADAVHVLETADQFGGSAIFLLGEITRRIVPELERVNRRRASEGKRRIKLGGVAGFPDGGSLTEIKCAEAAKMLELGCDEIDCVQNVGLAREGDWKGVEADLVALRKTTEGKTLKVILECPYLNDEQIAMAARVAYNAGADWIKTSTGWPEKNKTTPANVALMRRVLGPDANIKAAGGVRSLQNLLDLHTAGARLFGISWSSVVKIMEEIQERVT
ncbi:MAG: deoxyribose-phosphate aldolase [Planctomycetia bacterium]|nr:deoxyribose-phosphate aldolase [Planctomycetia bacterium]